MKLRHMLAALALITPLLGNAAPDQQPVPLVEVDGFPVTNLHLAIFAAQSLGQSKQPSQQQQITLLNELVNTFMVAKSPEGKALVDNSEVAAAIELASARLVAQALINDKTQQIEISEDALQALYEKEYGDLSGVELKARHILLESEDDAKKVIGELNGGADFAELAKQRSTGPSSSVGGDLGWFTPDQMVGAFSDALLKMQNGKYSESPVKTQFGWHVILHEDSRDVPTPSLEDVRDELEKKLRTQELAAFIKGIRERAEIEILDNAVKKAD